MKRTRGMFGKRLLVVALTASMLTGTVDVTTLQAAAQTKQQEETENLTVNTPDEVSVRTIMDVPEQQEIDTEIEEPENEQPGKDEEQPEIPIRRPEKKRTEKKRQRGSGQHSPTSTARRSPRARRVTVSIPSMIPTRMEPAICWSSAAKVQWLVMHKEMKADPG